MKRSIVGAVLALALAVLAGPAPDTLAEPRGAVTIGIPTDITPLDPTMSPEVNGLNVALSVMEPLLYGH